MGRRLGLGKNIFNYCDCAWEGYTVSLLRTEEGYSVWVPGLPGCASQGRTRPRGWRCRIERWGRRAVRALGGSDDPQIRSCQCAFDGRHLRFIERGTLGVIGKAEYRGRRDSAEVEPRGLIYRGAKAHQRLHSTGGMIRQTSRRSLEIGKAKVPHSAEPPGRLVSFR